jgi:lysophospholipase L1-like esterase
VRPILPRRRTIVFAAISVAIATVAGLVAIELGLRLSGRYASYSEKMGKPYASPYEQPVAEPWCWCRPAHHRGSYAQPEFDYVWMTNGEGIRDHDHPIAKPAGEYRIVVLGDSFTEGVGAEFSESYPRVLERNLAARFSRPIRVISGGVAGSDPIFEYFLLVHRLLKYQPDLVIVMANGSDIGDVIARGGMDRFDESGSLKPRRAPRAEWWYRRSHMARALLLDLFHYSHSLLSPKNEERQHARALCDILDAASAFQSLARQRGFRFLLAYHPYCYHFTQPGSLLDLAPLEKAFADRDIDYFDLTPHLRTRITPPASDYYWPIDLHCTARGYQAFADCLAERVAPLVEADLRP